MSECLNATISVCFWCGEDKNEMAIANKLIDCDSNEKMPMRTVMDYEPCEKCKKEWDGGTAIIEVTENEIPDGRPEIVKGAYPTGRIWVLENEVAKDFFKDKHNKVMFIEEELAKKIGLYELAEKYQEEEKKD